MSGDGRVKMTGDDAGNAAVGFLYIVLVVPVLMFLFVSAVYFDLYTGPGSELSPDTWSNALLFVTAVGIVGIVVAYILGRPDETLSEKPATKAAGGGGLKFSVKEEDGGGSGGGDGGMSGGKGVSGDSGEEEEEDGEEAADAGDLNGTGVRVSAGEGGGDGPKRNAQAAHPLIPRAGGVNLTNRRLITYPVEAGRGIFCETLVPVDSLTALRHRQKVGEETWVRET